MPALHRLEAKLPGQGRWAQAKRIGLIVVSFLVIFGVLALLGYYMVTSVADSFAVLVHNAPQYLTGGLANLQSWLGSFREWLPPEFHKEIDGMVEELSSLTGQAIRSVIARTASAVSASTGLLLSLFSLPIFLFYVMKDWERLNKGLYSLVGPGLGRRAKDIANILDFVVGRWLKSQIVLALTVFVMCLLGLSVMGIGPAPALAALAGLMEFVPIVGPWIGGIAAVVVVLAIAPAKALWVAVLYIVVQLIENALLRPKIQGAYLQVHPVVIVVLLPVATYFAGVWGMVLYVPLVALAVEVFKYVQQSVSAE